MIEFRDVTKIFGSGETRVPAVNGLSFTIPRGAFWALMGPSGSGKSTVLHLIAGLTPPTSGSVLVEGADVARMTRKEAAAFLVEEVLADTVSSRKVFASPTRGGRASTPSSSSRRPTPRGRCARSSR